MAPDTISIARIIQLRVPIGWQEAVEVTVAARAVAASTGKPITLEGCHLSATGIVELSSKSAGSHESKVSPMQLLSALIEGHPAPAELWALAKSDGSQAPAAAGESVAGPTDLSWFALPNGAQEIARLAARALAALSEEGARSALDRLRSEVAQHPNAEPAKPKPPRRLKRWAGIGLAGVAATGAFWVATQDDENQWTTAGADLLASAAALISSSPAPGEVTALASAADLETPRVPAAGVSPGSSRPALRVSQAGEPYLQGETEPADDGAAIVATSEVAAPPVEVEPAPAPVEIAGVFSASDTSVEPPTLVYPQLRSEPTAESAPVPSTIELTVDPSGRVVRVRLDPGRPPTVYDRMLVSAAKTWQFKPALRDGQPVSYLLRVPVTR